MNLAPRLSHLFLGGRAHVGCGNDGAEAAGGRDGLQSGDARAHDEDLRGRHGAGRGHHHRQRAAILGGGVDHGTVAGEIGLARKYVHRLSAGDARQKLHRKGGQAGIGHGAQRVFVAVRVHDGDDDGAALKARQLRSQRPPHLEHDIGAIHRVAGHCGAGCGIIRIEDSGFHPRAGFNGHFGAEPDDFLDGLGRRGDPRFARIDLGSNRNFHEFLRHLPG